MKRRAIRNTAGVTLPMVRHYGMELRNFFPVRPDETGGAKVLAPASNVPHVANRDVVRHGVVEYDRALPDEVISGFQFVPLFNDADHAADVIVDLAIDGKMLGYAQRSEDAKLGAERVALSAASRLSEKVRYNIAGQFRPDELRQHFRAAMLRRGLFTPRNASPNRRYRSNSAIAERRADREVRETVGEGEDAYEKSSWTTDLTPPRLTRGHMREQATLDAAKIARRTDGEIYRLPLRPGEEYRVSRARYIDAGNFGAAFQVEVDDGFRIVKIPSAIDVQQRAWTREAQTRNLRHEAGVANELVAKGYRCIPRSVYTEFGGGTPAIVREYGEPAGTITGPEYSELERELVEIERKYGWSVHDKLALYRRVDDTVFVADVGFWTAPRKRAKSAKPRKWDAFDSDLPHLLEKAQKEHGVTSVQTLPRLLSHANTIMKHTWKRDIHAMEADLAQDFLTSLKERVDAGMQNPRETLPAKRRAEELLAKYGKPAPGRMRRKKS